MPTILKRSWANTATLQSTEHCEGAGTVLVLLEMKLPADRDQLFVKQAVTVIRILQSGPRCLTLLTISTITDRIGAVNVRLYHPQCGGFEFLYIGMTWCKVS